MKQPTDIDPFAAIYLSAGADLIEFGIDDGLEPCKGNRGGTKKKKFWLAGGSEHQAGLTYAEKRN